MIVFGIFKTKIINLPKFLQPTKRVNLRQLLFDLIILDKRHMKFVLGTYLNLFLF